MCLIKRYKRWRRRRRDRIYEGPCEDGGTRIRHDTDAPKEICSRELIRFSCRFSAYSLQREESGLWQGVYSFSASKGEGVVACTAKCNNPLALPEGERNFTGGEDVLIALEELLREHGVVRYNGSYYKVSGLPDFYGATVDAAEIEKMEESPMKKEYQRMLEADFIISESALEILYRPHEGEESLAAEKGWTVTGEGFVIERFPARIEDGVLMLDYKKDGTGYFPVFWDEEDCLSISGGIMKIQKA